MIAKKRYEISKILLPSCFGNFILTYINNVNPISAHKPLPIKGIFAKLFSKSINLESIYPIISGKTKSNIAYIPVNLSAFLFFSILIPQLLHSS